MSPICTGLCPGTNESAGKRLSGRTRQANRTLRAALVESARAAVCKRDCYLAAQYRRLVKRRGDKKAIVAVAHSILVIAYHVLRDGQSYRELGGGYFDPLNTARLTRYCTKQAGCPRLRRHPDEIWRLRLSPPLFVRSANTRRRFMASAGDKQGTTHRRF